jgi:hypothetical protein
VGTIDLDVTITEQHRYNSRVTNYPVEDGTIVSDHIINEPDTLTLQALVTDTPLSILSLPNRSVDVFNRLIEIQQKRELITVITGLKIYDSMAITSLDVPRNLTTGQSLTFTIELQKVTLDTSVRVQLNNGNAFGGPQSSISRDQVAPDSIFPLLARDPAGSLKDQASSGINAGLQSLIPIPIAAVARVLTIKAFIQGLL